MTPFATGFKQVGLSAEKGWNLDDVGYLGYGFHEDAVRSAVAIGRKFGIEL